ncbi:xanthine dehydrogenase accessory protein XdhC [Qingshengfaniella alkalisoli]|uniref:Xanthine dehydrogenase accessory protein XdhC n=1 Tax=Qingshengfaniella alkalisoli TaxID=2599296 RepID=A0A5B8J0L9_9RHOB|nr:xanthine dehydrogenase accessory protein XdhC [Qingshengfaniella alkalisoli]QDY71333.1 xanthine dehydrogenase accessory protein XdhC [Qingshengfaniella alkalisoli]
MTWLPADIDAFLADAGPVACVKITKVAGSSPREVGAWMLVSQSGMIGTIGGGQLEYMAIDEARAQLQRDEDHGVMDIPLGPEIGQCCGGRVGLSITRLGGEERQVLLRRVAGEREQFPMVYIFGAGHVGRALAKALTLLPVRLLLVDSRADELKLADDAIPRMHTPLPEAVVRDAEPNSAFVVLTHDHSLDFLICREALLRGDAAYVGMIGSKTKRASFRRWCASLKNDVPSNDTELVCPIGAGFSTDKRPEVIASFVAAEIMGRLTADVVKPPSVQAEGKTASSR